jgi:prepilin-type processing-associated H-X9-DG protein
MPVAEVAQILNPSEIITIMDGSQVKGHWNWSAEPVARAVDSWIIFWINNNSSKAASMNNTVKGSTVDTSVWDYPPGADLRWRQQNNTAANVLFVDGHAETRQKGSILRRNLVPKNYRLTP